jgi:O-acetylhomoserine/O-acetylserine sulfhydrylase-like pyridoxal-dependent enzyme
MKTGFTTTILHSDLESPIEHYAVHKPMHMAVAYGYPDSHDLVKVFKNEMPGYAYGRQGDPTTAALEAKVTKMEEGVATACFSTGMAAIAATFRAAARRRSRGIDLVPVREHQQPVRHFNTLGCEVSRRRDGRGERGAGAAPD